MVARINEENKQMLRRIMLTKTSYDHVDLELEYRVQTGKQTDRLSDSSKPRIFIHYHSHYTLLSICIWIITMEF